jgi:hypothetical protein
MLSRHSTQEGGLYQQVLDRLRDPHTSVKDVAAALDLTISQVVGVLSNPNDPRAVELDRVRLERSGLALNFQFDDGERQLLALRLGLPETASDEELQSAIARWLMQGMGPPEPSPAPSYITMERAVAAADGIRNRGERLRRKQEIIRQAQEERRRRERSRYNDADDRPVDLDPSGSYPAVWLSPQAGLEIPPGQAA